MRRQDIVIESSGNLQVRKQNTYSLEIKEDFGKFYFFSTKQSLFLVVKKEKAANWLKIHKGNKTWDFLPILKGVYYFIVSYFMVKIVLLLMFFWPF